MMIDPTPNAERPDYRYDVARADAMEAKAKMWRSVAALANLIYCVALLASLLILGSYVWTLTPWS